MTPLQKGLTQHYTTPVMAPPAILALPANEAMVEQVLRFCAKKLLFAVASYMKLIYPERKRFGPVRTGYVLVWKKHNQPVGLSILVDSMLAKINQILDNPRFLQASILLLAGLLAILVIQNKNKLQAQTFSSAFPIEEIIIGQKIQPVNLESIDGTIYDTEELGGEYKLLIFFTTNCPYCAKDIPLWREMYKQGASRNIPVIAITTETDILSLSEYIYQNNIPFPILLDKQQDLFTQLSISVTPIKILFSSDWRVLQVWEGWTTQRSGQSDLGGIYAFFNILPDKMPIAP